MYKNLKKLYKDHPYLLYVDEAGISSIMSSCDKVKDKDLIAACALILKSKENNEATK
jgi:hypothetical protein